ncbi:hypothetical protein Egran_00038, partial [Elaphomyces granulatus]
MCTNSEVEDELIPTFMTLLAASRIQNLGAYSIRLPAVIITGIDDLIDNHLMPLIETDPYSDFVRPPTVESRLVAKLPRGRQTTINGTAAYSIVSCERPDHIRHGSTQGGGPLIKPILASKCVVPLKLLSTDRTTVHVHSLVGCEVLAPFFRSDTNWRAAVAKVLKTL